MKSQICIYILYLIYKDNIRKNNKSWTTKPVDITTYCKKKSNMINEIRFMSTFISSKVLIFFFFIILNYINSLSTF